MISQKDLSRMKIQNLPGCRFFAPETNFSITNQFSGLLVGTSSGEWNTGSIADSCVGRGGGQQVLWSARTSLFVARALNLTSSKKAELWKCWHGVLSHSASSSTFFSALLLWWGRVGRQQAWATRGMAPNVKKRNKIKKTVNSSRLICILATMFLSFKFWVGWECFSGRKGCPHIWGQRSRRTRAPAQALSGKVIIMYNCCKHLAKINS